MRVRVPHGVQRATPKGPVRVSLVGQDSRLSPDRPGFKSRTRKPSPFVLRARAAQKRTGELRHGESNPGHLRDRQRCSQLHHVGPKTHRQGAPARDRTGDLSVNSRPLCRLSHGSRRSIVVYCTCLVSRGSRVRVPPSAVRASVAEWSKATDSSSVLLVEAWVRTPPDAALLLHRLAGGLGLVGHDGCLTRSRSRVRSSEPVLVSRFVLFAAGSARSATKIAKGRPSEGARARRAACAWRTRGAGARARPRVLGTGGGGAPTATERQTEEHRAGA